MIFCIFSKIIGYNLVNKQQFVCITVYISPEVSFCLSLGRSITQRAGSIFHLSCTQYVFKLLDSIASLTIKITLINTELAEPQNVQSVRLLTFHLLHFDQETINIVPRVVNIQGCFCVPLLSSTHNFLNQQHF